MTRPRAPTSILLLVLAFVLAACSEPSRAPVSPRLVILYATCSLSRSHLAPYSGGVRYTPALERFATESVTFERHRTESGQSGTAFAALFSGTHAGEHGVYRHPAHLPPDTILITEAFAEAGWDVHTWLEHLMATAALGYGQGTPEANVHPGRLESGDPSFQAILRRLADDPEYRAFLVTNFTVTHGPYDGEQLEEFCAAHPAECEPTLDREEFERLRALYVENNLALSFDYPGALQALELSESEIAQLIDVVETLYKAGVYRLDRMFGQVVEAIDDPGLRDQSLIAFTSDHGEILFRENAEFRWTHGFQLAPEVLDVALVLRGPGVGVVPGRYPGVTGSIDVFPTLASLSGLPSPTGVEGVDRAAALRRESHPPEAVAFSHTALFPDDTSKYPHLESVRPTPGADGMWVALRRGDRVYKLRDPASGARPVAFELGSDPGEEANVYDSALPSDRAAAAQLREYRQRLRDGYRERRARDMENLRRLEALKELGYID